jgi:hypothetical protein
MCRLALSLISLIFSVLVFTPALAFSFRRSVPEYVSANCILVQTVMDVWSMDTEISQLNFQLKNMSLCQSDYKLWFWEEPDQLDLQNLYRLQWLSLMRVSSIQMELEREVDRLKEIKQEENNEKENALHEFWSILVTINTIFSSLWILRKLTMPLFKSFAIVAYLVMRSSKFFFTMAIKSFPLSLNVFHITAVYFLRAIRYAFISIFLALYIFFNYVELLLRLTYVNLSALCLLFVMEYEKLLKPRSEKLMKWTKATSNSEISLNIASIVNYNSFETRLIGIPEVKSMASSIVYYNNVNYIGPLQSMLDLNTLSERVFKILIKEKYFAREIMDVQLNCIKGNPLSVDLLFMDRFCRKTLIFTLEMKIIQNSLFFVLKTNYDFVYKFAIDLQKVRADQMRDVVSEFFRSFRMLAVDEKFFCILKKNFEKFFSNSIRTYIAQDLEYKNENKIEEIQSDEVKCEDYSEAYVVSEQKESLEVKDENNAEVKGEDDAESDVFNEQTTYIFEGKEINFAVGHIHILSKTQVGSKFLQRCIEEEKNIKQVEAICKEVLDHLIDLSMDVFANYLCQSVYAYLNNHKRLEYLRILGNKIVDISCNRQGTRVVQKLITYSAPNKAERELIAFYLAEDIMKLMLDPHGSHVAIAFIQNNHSDTLSGTLNAVCQNVIQIVVDSYGVNVLKHLMEKCENDCQTKLITTIVEKAPEFVNNQYGNYALQHIVGMKNIVYDGLLHSQLRGRYYVLSKQKYSSNVVEKCIESFDSALKIKLISELIESAEILSLMEDSFGNFVLQKALRFSCKEQTRALIAVIQPNLKRLRKSNIRKKWENSIASAERK